MIHDSINVFKTIKNSRQFYLSVPINEVHSDQKVVKQKPKFNRIMCENNIL